jgi:chemotaxis protein MotA
VSYPFRRLISFTKVVKKLFLTSDEKPQEAIVRIIELANIARKEGLLALE